MLSLNRSPYNLQSNMYNNILEHGSSHKTDITSLCYEVIHTVINVYLVPKMKASQYRGTMFILNLQIDNRENKIAFFIKLFYNTLSSSGPFKNI